MPRAKSVHKYSQEYYDLCKRAHLKCVKIPFNTDSAARNFRLEMYRFRQALYKALLANPSSEDLQLSVLFAEDLEFSIKDKVLSVKKKLSSYAQKIKEALDESWRKNWNNESVS